MVCSVAYRYLIGCNFDENKAQAVIRQLPYKVNSKEGRPIVQIEINGWKEEFTPEEISAMVIGRMKEMAEAYIGRKVTHAVVTVPAYFNVSPYPSRSELSYKNR